MTRDPYRLDDPLRVTRLERAMRPYDPARDIAEYLLECFTAQHPDDPGPTPPEVDEPEHDPAAADGVCTRCGTPLELDGCSSANVRLR